MSTQGAEHAVTPETLKRLDRPGPRYTSYPTAPVWQDDFGDHEYRGALERASQRPDDPLSLYVHIPFCNERCAFCGCNVIISKKPSIADKYLEYVERELAMAVKMLGRRQRVTQMHWGGGTPTYLPPDLIKRLYAHIATHFDIAVDAELALEADPRVTSREQLELLRSLGFNRISMGVQDLDWGVQEAIGRYQSEDQTRTLFNLSREFGFYSVNIDLVYGLPAQTVDTWKRTLEGVAELRPNRLAVYSYAYLPERLHNQRHIDESLLPAPGVKYQLLAMARDVFQSAGYAAIGMDHFALPDDELTTAMEAGRLNRNFMGYTVNAAPDMVAFGVSSIGEVGDAYAQNEKKLSRYFEALDDGRFPTACGWQMSHDDCVRNWVIRQLTCNFHLPIAELKERFDVEYDTYFAAEEAALKPFYDDGFVRRTDNGLVIEGLGRVFIRNIAMIFDAYLNEKLKHVQFSRTV